MKLPLITVIIPVYNVEKYLHDCLQSVLNQTYLNLEVIVIDDGATDNSGEIINLYAHKDSRIKAIHKKNGGVSSARNTGLNMATGEYICFIDADDWIEPYTLELTLSKLLETKTDLCFFDIVKEFKNRQIYCPALPTKQEYYKNLESLETLNLYMFHTENVNFLFKSSLISKNIRYNERLKIGEDTIFKFKIYEKLESFSYLQKGMYHYRMNGYSCTSKPNFQLPEIIFYRYTCLCEVIKMGNYPHNAEVVPNTIEWIRGLPEIVRLAYSNSGFFKCDYEFIEQYINRNEFKRALLNYNKQTAGRLANLYLIFGHLNKATITIVYLIYKIYYIIIKKERFL